MMVEAATTRELQGHHPRRLGRCAAGERFHRQASARSAAGGPGHLLSHRFHDIAAPMIAARRRSAASARRRTTGATCRSCGPATPRAGGVSTNRAAACAPTRRCCANRPDFFIHCGDNIYADCPLGAERELPNGEVWRNIVTEEKSRVAETLADYRGNYKYNLLDRNLRAFNAEVPMFAQWDDHEVTNDWWPGMPLRVGAPTSRALAARGRRAFHEFTPTRRSLPSAGASIADRLRPAARRLLLDMRSYRGPNGDGRQERWPGRAFSDPRRSRGSNASWRPRARPGR